MTADIFAGDSSNIVFVIKCLRDNHRKSVVNLLESAISDSLLILDSDQSKFIPNVQQSVLSLLRATFEKSEISDYEDVAEHCFAINLQGKIKVFKVKNNSVLTTLEKKFKTERCQVYLDFDSYVDSKNSSFASEHSHKKLENFSLKHAIKHKSVRSSEDCPKAVICEVVERKHLSEGIQKCSCDDKCREDFSVKKFRGKIKKLKINLNHYSCRQHCSLSENNTAAGSVGGRVGSRCESDCGKSDSKLCRVIKSKQKRRDRYAYHLGLLGGKRLETGHGNAAENQNDQEHTKQSDSNVTISSLREKLSKLLQSFILKRLRKETSLPLSNQPWGEPVILAYPGGRKKKNDRPVDRRSQRHQAQTSTILAQPTDDDPTPPTLQSLPSDRYALPTQPENRNLQHLLSSFTPRVEPITASTQQLRRLSSRPRHQQYVDEAARRASFTNWPSNTGQNAENMITNGFFYTGRVDLIRCYMCGIGLKDWSADDEPLFEHVRHSPDCPFLFTFLGQDVLDAYKAALLPGRAQPASARSDGQSTEGATSRPEGVATASGDGGVAPVRNPAYEDLRRRIESFSEWPRDRTQTPRQLAEAGFFHTGDGDTVRCFQCDGGLRRWDPRDDPWIEHTRWFPHCQYVRQKKGVEYVELVQRAIRESAGEDEEPYDQAAGGMANLTVNPELTSEPQEPPVTPQTILDMGYTRESLSKAMEIANEKGMVNYTPKDLLEILLEIQPEGQLEPKPQVTQETSQGASGGQETEDDPLFVTIENKSLKKVLKCSECKVRDKNILFLPCTHHVLCEQCAEAATKCPVCEHDIDRKIKTYLS